MQTNFAAKVADRNDYKGKLRTVGPVLSDTVMGGGWHDCLSVSGQQSPHWSKQFASPLATGTSSWRHGRTHTWDGYKISCNLVTTLVA